MDEIYNDSVFELSRTFDMSFNNKLQHTYYFDDSHRKLVFFDGSVDDIPYSKIKGFSSKVEKKDSQVEQNFWDKLLNHPVKIYRWCTNIEVTIDVERKDFDGKTIDAKCVIHLYKHHKYDDKLLLSSKKINYAIKQKDWICEHLMGILKRNKQLHQQAELKRIKKRQAAILTLNKLVQKESKAICIAINVTGADKQRDGLLEMTILDGNGKILFNSLLKPLHKRQWPKAEMKTHIRSIDVKGKPHFNDKDVLDKVQNIFNAATYVIGHNLHFVIPFLKAKWLEIPSNLFQYDLMTQFATVLKEEDTYNRGYKLPSLEQCAGYYKYKSEEPLRGTLSQAQASLYCFNQMLKNKVYVDNSDIFFFTPKTITW